MHESSFLRMQWIEKEFLARMRDEEIRILDVGSMDINGSYRAIFSDRKYSYTGLDMAAGPNVDIVLPKPYDWSMITDAAFDVVVSGQVFEHVEFFWKTFEKMVRVLKAGGLMAIIVPRLQNRHRYQG